MKITIIFGFLYMFLLSGCASYSSVHLPRCAETVTTIGMANRANSKIVLLDHRWDLPFSSTLLIHKMANGSKKVFHITNSTPNVGNLLIGGGGMLLGSIILTTSIYNSAFAVTPQAHLQNQQNLVLGGILGASGFVISFIGWRPSGDTLLQDPHCLVPTPPKQATPEDSVTKKNEKTSQPLTAKESSESFKSTLEKTPVGSAPPAP